MSTSDVWAITPSTDDDRYRADASISGAGALTLITQDAGVNGIGYKIDITSAGNDTGITFTIVGHKVGDLTGTATTEVVTGANAGAATSTNFYAYIESITASGASAGNVKIGTTGSLALPRTRIRGFQYVGNSSAGSVVFNLNSTTGAELLKVNTPASATVTQQMSIPGAGILTTRGSNTDFAIMTLTNVALITVFCG